MSLYKPATDGDFMIGRIKGLVRRVDQLESRLQVLEGKFGHLAQSFDAHYNITHGADICECDPGSCDCDGVDLENEEASEYTLDAVVGKKERRRRQIVDDIKALLDEL